MNTREPDRLGAQKGTAAIEELGGITRLSSEAKSSTPGDGERRRAFLLLGIVIVIAALISALLAHALHSGSTTGIPTRVKPATHLIVIMVDGLGASDLQGQSMPNLNKLEATGTTFSNAWVGQVEATVPSSAATVGSGFNPAHHGVPGLLWRDENSGQLVRAAAPAQVQLGALDQVLESSGISSLAGDLKASLPAATVLSVGGEGCVGADAAGTWLADYILCPVRAKGGWQLSSVTGHSLPTAIARSLATSIRAASGRNLAPTVEGWRLGQEDEWITRHAVSAMRATTPRMTFISYPEIGALLRFVPQAERAQVLRQLLVGLDRDLGLLVKELKRERIFDQTIFVVTSTRALAPAIQRVPISDVDLPVLAAGGQELYVSSDMASFVGLQDPLQAHPTAQAMQSAGIPHVDAIFYKSGSGTSWGYRAQYFSPDVSNAFGSSVSFLLGTLASARSPDVVVVYAPGTMVGDAHVGRFRWTSGSLGLQWQDQHIPLIISGHGIGSGVKSTFPARLVDIAPTVETALGLPLIHSDGVTLADALSSPSSLVTQAQRRERAKLFPVIQALKARARR
jgi:Type I phosphodiesterase / nucleotide pyrophosphatase